MKNFLDTHGLETYDHNIKEYINASNVIETVKVNGSALTPDENKAVNVSVPVVANAIASGDTGYVTGDMVYNTLGDLETFLSNY